MRRSTRVCHRIVACLLVLAGLGALAAGAAPARSPAPQGCNPRWPVIAHRPGGALITHAGSLPTACAVPDGYATSETTLAISPDGAIFFSPANTENTLARSFDGGDFWSLGAPQTMQYTSLWNTVDPFVTVDRRTGRVFWVRATGELRTAPVLVEESPLGWQASTAAAYAHGFQVYASADDGLNWTTANYQDEATGDWEKIFVGPPSAAGPKPSGYPDVVYVCANAPFEVSGPGRACYRSLDGGKTFVQAGTVTPTASSPNDACPALAGGANGGVAADGTFYQPQSCSGGSWVAVSRDEAATWTWYAIPGAPGTNGLSSNLQLALDWAGNLYALWSDATKIDLEISRDGGKSWSHAISVGVPGQHLFDLPELAAGPAGHIGVAYYAGPSSSSKVLSAYLTETSDALATRPVFVSGALNDPAHPIFRDYGLSGNVTPRADYIGAAYDGAGNLWGGLVKQLGQPDASGVVPTTGYIGTLKPASARPKPHPKPKPKRQPKARRPPRRNPTPRKPVGPGRRGDPDHDGDHDAPGQN